MDSILSERIAAVLEGCKRQLKDIALTPPDIMRYRNELIDALGNEKEKNLLAQQLELERNYSILSQKQVELKGLSNKMKYASVQGEIHHISNKLKENAKNLGRLLKENPTVKANLAKIQSDVNDLIELISATIIELQQHGEYSLLEKKVGEYSIRSKKIRDDIAADKVEIASQIKELKNDIISERQSHSLITSNMQSEINCITEKLLAIRNGTCESTIMHRSGVLARKDSALLFLKQKESERRDEIAELRELIKKEITAHEKITQFLTKKYADMEIELANHHDNFSQTFKKKEDELSIATRERDDNLSVLLTLERRWNNDLATEKQRNEDAEAEKQRALASKLQKEKEHYASILIQRKCKSYLKQQAKLKKKQAPKKKKGKKGGKKGKKK